MRTRDVCIAVYLVVQLLLPLSYYTVRDDRFDERFSWRMFSDIRMLKCQAAYTRGTSPVTLSQEFHMAWNTLVQRGRGDVIDAVTAELCKDASGQELYLRLECREADGRQNLILDGSDDVCAMQGG